MWVLKDGHKFFDTAPMETWFIPSSLEPQWAHDWLAL